MAAYLMSRNKYNYFAHRNISQDSYADYILPKYIHGNLPNKSDGNILDIGCGFGQALLQIRKLGYSNVEGVDISREAVDYCKAENLNVHLINDLTEYILSAGTNNYDLIIMSHVLEHINKSEIIDTLKLIKNNLLKYDGSFLVVVPNAQSNTGCYWAYEDFTHQTLFTAGSLYYVLRSAGFEKIIFLDPEGLEDSNPIIRIFKKLLLRIYSMKIYFWNLVTSSSYHKPSPIIYTYDIKALAR